MTKYKIIDIVHSGRKGIRGEKVAQSKYEDLVECTAYIDVDSIKPFQNVHMILKGHPNYDWWDTSALISYHTDSYDRLLFETVNSVYILEKID